MNISIDMKHISFVTYAVQRARNQNLNMKHLKKYKLILQLIVGMKDILMRGEE